jgi:hypothetical protein
MKTQNLENLKNIQKLNFSFGTMLVLEMSKSFHNQKIIILFVKNKNINYRKTLF